jgi:quinol monooxygenase YgiN
MKGYVVAVDFAATPENYAKLKELLVSNASASVANEPGCRQFDVYEVQSVPNHVFLYEIYDSEDAFKAHLNSTHYKEFAAATSSIITSRSVSRGSLLSANQKMP